MIFGTRIFISIALSLFAGSAVVIADPGDLLDQAVEENHGRRQVEVNDDSVAAIVDRADRLFDQKAFAEAVRLYEKAYRLAPNDQANFARMLVARRAAGLMTESDREALAIIEEQREATVASTFRNVRLAILQAREALALNEVPLAESRITDAEFTLRGLPRDVDATPYWRQLTQLRKSVARHRVEGGSSPQSASVHTKPHHSEGEVLLLGDSGEDATNEAPTESVEVRVVADNANSGELLDVDDLLQTTQRRLEYDRDIDLAIRTARADMLLTAAEAALPPAANGGMTFPADWAEKSARRSKYRGGEIYRSPEFTGPDGQTYYTAIYDLGDLVHPVPNFYAPWALSGLEHRIQMEDRAALRYRSQIFNGYADDLAAGLPLLHFFGGVDNNAVSTRTDPRETQRVLQMIDQFMR